jgi:pyruvate ferredoxin oxidoreductase beta subunit
MTTVKQILSEEESKREYFCAGNSTCAGCGLDLAIRWALKALGPKTVLVAPASCLNVVVGVWPKTAPDFPFFNMAFAAGAAAATGIKHGLNAVGKTDYTVMTFAGDGGTTDIGLQGLSGAAERGSDIIYVCYDNEAYMNTGTQRSSSTPFGAITTTTPYGKEQHKKNLPMIVAAHNPAYVATCSVSNPLDIYDKFKKAKDIKGFRYIHILAPCPPGWRYPSEDTIAQAKSAVETGVWPLFEIENNILTLSAGSKKFHDPTKRKPLKSYFGTQGRYRKIDDTILTGLQQDVDVWWAWIDRFLVHQELSENIGSKSS